MRYRGFEGSIEELVCGKLAEIEEREQVRILHAVESGSRAWGLASPDSDYDVRFVYVRPMEAYLRLDPGKDFIDWELDETLDINGWDLSKVLRHFHRSNAVLYEWADSPVVYGTTPEWKRVRETADGYFSCKAAMYHYYGTANKNYLEYLTEDMVRYKKYFYVLRPLLACSWIHQKACPPPVLFQDLADAVLEQDMRAAVRELAEKKMQMAEREKGKRLDDINGYIQEKLACLKQRIEAMADDRNGDWEKLNGLFLELVAQPWG